MNIVKINNRLIMAMGIAVSLLTAGCAAPTSTTASGTKTAKTAVRQLDWKTPTVREDGTALSLLAIAGYKIYYGSSSGNYTASLNVNSAVDASGGVVSDYSLASLPPGTYYIAMTTLDVGGRESPYSNEVKVTL